MKNKYFIYPSLIFITAFAKGAQTDSTNGSWNLQLRADYGFIIAHRPELKPVQEKHLKGFEISLARTSDGCKDWQNLYNFPNYGITFAAFDLGSPAYLGNGIVVYPFVDFPLSKNPKNKIHFRYGMGLGYVEKIFNAVDNYKNAAVGSHLNGVIHFDLHVEKNILKHSSLEFGAGITHYSNGSFSMPNLGINIATINLGYHHSFGNNSVINHRQISEINKKADLHLYTGGFIKKIVPPLGKNYFAAVISALHFKPINHKTAWGIGTDIFYDNSIPVRIKNREEKQTSEINNFRSGIYGAYHLSVGKMGIMFNMGYYLYNAYKYDGNIYHRICLRYYFEKTFICLNLKTHYARADFIELGFGYRLRK